MYVASSSTLPQYAPAVGSCACGIGALDFLASPMLATYRARKNPCCGLGQDEPIADPVVTDGTAAGIAAGGAVVGLLVYGGILALAGALSYQAGKAMAPSRAKEKKWGWIGVPVGMLTGPWGLGVMGWVSNKK